MRFRHEPKASCQLSPTKCGESQEGIVDDSGMRKFSEATVSVARASTVKTGYKACASNSSIVLLQVCFGQCF